jgi:hypothetical protein
MAITLFASLSLYLLLIYLSVKKDRFFLFWISSIGFLTVLVGLGKQRHLGQIPLLLATLHFLHSNLRGHKNNWIKNNLAWNQKFLAIALILFVVQVPMTLKRDFQNPFSTSSALAQRLDPNDLIIVQDSGKSTYLPMVLKAKVRVFTVFGGSFVNYSLLNTRSRTIPDLEKLQTSFNDVCNFLKPRRILLFTDPETRKYFSQLDGKLLFVSPTSIVSNEGGRELWLLANSSKEVDQFCTPDHVSNVMDGLKSKIVSYGN